ncbi:GDP-mannose 4,6-dehydratase, partial [Fischerella thermalis]|uniref:GDP-mannose 4,6-dehydratase n=1 Tax=Fischerella thermalis TaxID=372787 RepID=UPI001F33800B
MTKKALITGLTGQDGSYLAELLLEKGYQVFGLVRRSSTSNLERISHLSNQIQIVSGDLLDQSSLMDVVSECQPDEIYNLASQSYVPLSWTQPALTAEYTALGVSRLLEAIRRCKPDAKFYQASSSEVFGQPELLLTAGLGYLMAGLTVFLRDIPQTLGVILNIWLYLTPILYPAKAIPEEWRNLVFWLNPMTAIAEVYRDLVLVGEVKHWGEWVVTTVISAIVFCIGFSVY